MAHIRFQGAQLYVSSEVFSIVNRYKCLSYIFLTYLNTYGMGLRPIELFEFFPCGGRRYTSESAVYRREIPTYKDGPRVERVE